MMSDSRPASRRGLLALAVVSALALSGCVTVNSSGPGPTRMTGAGRPMRMYQELVVT